MQTQFRTRLFSLRQITFAILVTLLSFVVASQNVAARTVDPYVQIGQISVLGAPSSNWCYDIGVVDHEHHYYLADGSDYGVAKVQDSQHPKYLNMIGKGKFNGPAGCHKFDYSQQGPEGVLITHGELWAGDGTSRVFVYDPETGKQLDIINTHGNRRADEMAVGDGVLVVTNPDEVTPKNQPGVPFLTFIDVESHSIIGKLAFPQAKGNGLEQPFWYHGKFYLSVPGTTKNKGGEVDVIDPKSMSIEHVFPVTNCTPAGLDINDDGEAVVGCASGPQVLMDIATGHIIARVNVTGVDMVATYQDHFFFPSYATAKLYITDSQGHFLQQPIPTSAASHTVTVDPLTGHVFVPLDGGKIAVLAAQ